jgi:hypothetical protein
VARLLAGHKFTNADVQAAAARAQKEALGMVAVEPDWAEPPAA